jgi:UDP-N-acetylglucosamine 1-carboxyvinyltransferase
MPIQNRIRISGGMPLLGDVHISGSKNAISAILPALCLSESSEPSILRGVPGIDDASTLCSILEETGLTVNHRQDLNEICVQGQVKYNRLSALHAPKIRASNLFLGALLARTGEVHMPFCGGDKIGDRPLDIHFYVFDKFKIKTEIDEGDIHCQATEFPLKGTTIFLRYPSVGATENAIILAAKAQGHTTIYNAACEPEVTDLVVALNKMGANISGAGTPIIRITGVRKINALDHEVIPDRIETSTFMLAFACTRGKGRIFGSIPEHCISVINTLNDAGVNVSYSDAMIAIDATTGDFKALRISALPYPGVPTDVQPLLSVFATQCEGNSVISDAVHKERFAYITEYAKMGIDLTHSYDQVCITGPQMLTNAIVAGGDIRSVSTLVLAALVAEKESIVGGCEHLNRGYDSFVHKLGSLGARIDLI